MTYIGLKILSQKKTVDCMALWVIPVVKDRGGRTSAKHDLAVKVSQYVWGACTHCFRQGRLDSIFKLKELKLLIEKALPQKYVSLTSLWRIEAREVDLQSWQCKKILILNFITVYSYLDWFTNPKMDHIANLLFLLML